MGKRGPAPEPTALKLVKGTRSDRVNTQEPKPPAKDGPPSCPSWLPSYGKREWRRLAPQLWRAGKLLTEWDRETFAAYCTAVAIHKAAVEKLCDKGEPEILVYTEHGRAKHPALQVVRDQAQAIRTLGQEFGLTPSARSSIKVGGSEGDKQGAERLLS